MDEFIAYGSSTELPTIHVISDSVGLTAQAVARAAAAQFGVTNPVIEVLPKVRTFEEIKEFIDEHSAVHKRNTGDGRMLVFYTLVDRDLSRQLAEYAGGRDDIVAVDLVTDAIGAIAHMTGKQPSTKPGGLHVADQYYFRRIEAIEFTIAHDDGRNPSCIRPTSCFWACRARRRRPRPSTCRSRATKWRTSPSIPPPSLRRSSSRSTVRGCSD